MRILSEHEFDRVTRCFNNTRIDYPREKTVHQLFEEQVERTPDATAVIACDKTLSYRELNEDANRIAHGLIARGVKPGDIVAFMLHRKSYLITAMLGILKSGAAYIPIDPDYPQERIDFMLEDSRASFLITDENTSDLLLSSCDNNPDVALPQPAVYCCLNTSGSTGKPKMPLLLHSSLVSFIYANKQLWKNVETSIATSIVTFDACILETILSLIQGYRVILASEEQIYDQLKFEALVSGSCNCFMFSTPTKMCNYIQNSTDPTYTRAIASLVLGGEVFDRDLYKQLRTYTEATLFNGYGPAETTLGVLFKELTSDDITIGRPIANTQIYIVDKYMRPVPIGVKGELCIAGDCVGAGYLNQPELTAERFLDNPFGEGKLYKTGDLAKWRENGEVEYIGRNDFQVKIRGLRIELGEIEAVISAVQGVRQAIVVARKDENGRQLLCAFFTGEPIEGRLIRKEISKKLPKYMLPHIIMHIEAMPLTSSGKVNRNALPEVALDGISSAVDYVAPKTETERILCSLIAEVLGCERVGTADDFFDLGGDSLKAIELAVKAQRKGVPVNLQDVFDHPNVSELCASLRATTGNAPKYNEEDFAAIHKLLSKNVLELPPPEESNMGNLLLTGATGFFGAHILREYLEATDGTAYCVVRRQNDVKASHRLAETLHAYFSSRYDTMLGTRIIVLHGDLEKEHLGLSVLPDVQTVIHAAASVKHYGSWDYFYKTNVLGTQHIIDVARKLNARLMHISTMSVSGAIYADAMGAQGNAQARSFSEADLFIGQSLDNVYIRSKFEAEKAVLEAICDGLPANILRIGNLTNRASDGCFQTNYESNAFAQRVKAIVGMGIFPESLMTHAIEFTPVDEAARAALIIARHLTQNRTVFHLASAYPLLLTRLREIWQTLGINIRIVTDEEFI